jgi:ATP adenylyltransferase
MLMALLENNGEASETDIAKAILSHDQSQIEYYERITRGMVGRVLRSHSIVQKEGSNYKLVGLENLSNSQREELINLCQKKLYDYVKKRGNFVWQHRKKSLGYISGTLKYEVLKRAGFHCELCGISAEIKALEVDHIIPRNHGGSDDISNLQALCYSCNAMKRDRDDTDFRQVRESYKHREQGCPFCELPKERIFIKNELAQAIYDLFPATPLHTLVIPTRHIATYFELTRPELNACNSLLEEARNIALSKDKEVSGFNIGINNGEDAGQTIYHCHIHLIPRRKGDVENPRGGIRHVIAGKGSY